MAKLNEYLTVAEATTYIGCNANTEALGPGEQAARLAPPGSGVRAVFARRTRRVPTLNRRRGQEGGNRSEECQETV
ncbi:MAG: hypothetical protein ABIG44_00345 [Planctomycetota bacterium]